jgi:hypothetical protein
MAKAPVGDFKARKEAFLVLLANPRMTPALWVYHDSESYKNYPEDKLPKLFCLRVRMMDCSLLPFLVFVTLTVRVVLIDFCGKRFCLVRMSTNDNDKGIE